MHSLSDIIRTLNAAFIKRSTTPLTFFAWYYCYGIILILLKLHNSFRHNV